MDTAPKITEEQPVKPTAPLPSLTLDEALLRTLKQSPTLSGFSQEVKAREFKARQAALRPNPELSVEVENIAGSGDFSGTDSAEITVRVSQVFELGGKRARRQEVGSLERELAEREYEIARAEVLSETTERFIAVLAAQKRLLLAGEQVELTKKVLQTVEGRIATGKTAVIEKVRFQTLVAEARLRQNKARQELMAARQALASVWGSEEVDFATAQGPLDTVQSVPDWSELTSSLVHSPETALRKSASKRASRILALEQANRIPDLTISLGAKSDQDTGDNALVAEVSIPLPIFDRNQGTIAAARARKVKAEDEARSAQLQLRTALAEGWQKLHAAYSEVDVLRREILPATRQTFDAVAYGYQAGKYGFLEVLDAERTLFEAKSRYVDALTAYHQAVSELERLLGQKIFTDGGLSAPTENERGQS
jgi:cobalt-zinc-cadmium efflux system outer membrane protein